MIETEFGKYQLRGILGSGGLATVYQAYDTDLNREVALKILNSNWPVKSVVARRFQGELEIAQSLNHPHIIKIFEYGEVNERLYLAMEYMEKGSFSHYFAKARSMRLTTAGKILRELASALDYAHSQGVVHRDLKLENILLGAHNRLVLTDFGIAHVPNSTRLTVTGDVFGTPLYISPEQISAVKEVDFRADCYALGIIAYLLSVGYFPFSSESSWEMLHLHLNVAAPIPSNLNPRLPAELDAVLLRGLAKDPAERFPSAGEFAAAFTKAIKGAEAAETVVLAWQPTPQPTTPKDYAGLESFLNSPFKTSAMIEGTKPPQRHRISPLRMVAGIMTVLLVGLLSFSFGGSVLASLGLGSLKLNLPAATESVLPTASLPAPTAAQSPANSALAQPSEQVLADFLVTNTLAPSNTPQPTNTLAPTLQAESLTTPETQSSDALTLSALRSLFAATPAPTDSTEVQLAAQSATFIAPSATPSPTATLIAPSATPSPTASPTRVPATQVPPTAVPATRVPPTPIPPTHVPPTSVPPTQSSGGLLDPIVPPIVPTLIGKIL